METAIWIYEVAKPVLVSSPWILSHFLQDFLQDFNLDTDSCNLSPVRSASLPGFGIRVLETVLPRPQEYVQ